MRHERVNFFHPKSTLSPELPMLIGYSTPTFTLWCVQNHVREGMLRVLHGSSLEINLMPILGPTAGLG